MNFEALQAAFQDYVLHAAPGIKSSVREGPAASVQRRLRIYYDAYRLRLVEALSADYGALQALAGSETFAATCRAYIEATPSRVRNVRWYGAGLAHFLSETQPWAEQPWLAEIALFEWTLTLAFDAADAQSLAFSDLARVSAERWPGLVFHLHPSVHLLQLCCNAPALRTAVDEGRALPAPRMLNPPVHWLIWRRDDGAVHFRSLQVEEAETLHAVREGATFAEVCNRLSGLAGEDRAAQAAAGFLRTWVDEQLVAELTDRS
jgi:hypothetical protein